MQIEMECSVCGKIHAVDLRTLDETFVCDACEHPGQAMDEVEIDAVEKQIRTSEKMGLMAVFFTLSTLGALWVWLAAFDHDPRPQTFQETAFYIFVASAFFLLVTGLVNSLFNRKVFF